MGRAKAFEVEAKILDGNDPVLLHQQLADIVDQIRAGNGPYFAEVLTYRTCGHVGPENDDVLNYRPAEELKKWKLRDPVASLRAILNDGGVSGTELDKIDADIDGQVRRAVDLAKKAAFPDFAKALSLNWANSYSPIVARFASGPARFDGRQDETRLKPY